MTLILGNGIDLKVWSRTDRRTKVVVKSLLRLKRKLVIPLEFNQQVFHVTKTKIEAVEPAYVAEEFRTQHLELN